MEGNEKHYQVDAGRFIHRTVAGNHLLIPLNTAISEINGYIEINESAAFIFDSLKSPLTESELTELLRTKFSLTEETAKADTKEFLQKMIDVHMVNEI